MSLHWQNLKAIIRCSENTAQRDTLIKWTRLLSLPNLDARDHEYINLKLTNKKYTNLNTINDRTSTLLIKYITNNSQKCLKLWVYDTCDEIVNTWNFFRTVQYVQIFMYTRCALYNIVMLECMPSCCFLCSNKMKYIKVLFTIILSTIPDLCCHNRIFKSIFVLKHA